MFTSIYNTHLHIFAHRIIVAAFRERILVRKARALLLRVVQLHIRICNFLPANEQLKAVGEASCFIGRVASQIVSAGRSLQNVSGQ